MQCKECGNTVPNNALFCDICGQKVRDGYKEKIYCGNCGTELESGVEFCGVCGYAVKQGQDVGLSQRQPKKKRGLKIAVVSICFCFVVIVSGIGYLLYASRDNEQMNNTSKDTISSVSSKNQSMQHEEAIDENGEKKEDNFENDSSITDGDMESDATTVEGVSESDMEGMNDSQDGPQNSDRDDLYDSSLTYKRMSDIHNTKLVDDWEFEELKNVILDFDSQCEDYMNEIRDDVPVYLKKDSTAYNQQVEYKQKHPNLNQSYQQIDVINARHGKKYYYVWVTEVMNVSENGTAKQTTDHWVYKIEKDIDHWYICDYTVDPAF